MSNVGVVAVAGAPQKDVDIDAPFLRAAHADVLRAPPFRRLFYRRYIAEYQRRIDRDLRALRVVHLNDDLRKAIRGRVCAAVRTVAACSAWYAVSYSILRGGFKLALTAAVIATVAAAFLLPPHTPVAYDAVAMGFALVLLALYVLASLAIAQGWKFDLIWSIGWAALFVLAYRHSATASMLQSTLQYLHLRPSAPDMLLYVGKAGQELFLAGAVYTVIIAITAFIGGATYVLTTSLKKCQAEEEIIQTLLHLLDYIRRYRDQGYAFDFRRYVSRQLDWIADRFAYDFLRLYRATDADSALWQAQTALRLASGIRELKRSIILPTGDIVERLESKLISALGYAATGRWKYLPQADSVAAKIANKRDRIVAVLQGFISLAVPLAIAVFAILKLDEPLRSSLAIPFISLAVVNVLAIMNPAGFDKRVDATKSLVEVIRGNAGK